MTDSVQMNTGPTQYPSSSSHKERVNDQPIQEPGLKQYVNTVKELESERREGTKIKLSDEYLIQSIEEANKRVHGSLTSLEFSIHEKTKEIMVKVKDQETGEVIRELPPEKVLDMIAGMLELAGLLIDERR